MACIVAPAPAADVAMATAANAAIERNSISDCTDGSGDALEAKRPELHPAGSGAALQLQQHHLQQLISLQHAALAGTGALLCCSELLMHTIHDIRRFEGVVCRCCPPWVWQRTAAAVCAHCLTVAVGQLRPALVPDACTHRAS